MARFWWVLVVAWSGSLLCVSCGGKSGSTAVGDLFVEAFDANNQPLSGVELSTDPETKTAVTDDFGSALLDHEPTGAYRVLGAIGSLRASRSIRVNEGETTTVELVFDVIDGMSFGGDGSGRAGDSSVGGSPGSGAGSGGIPGKGGATGSGGSVDADYIDVATQVAALAVDSQRPYLYALDSVNNNMLFINLTTEKVEKTLFVGSQPVDLDFDDANKNAYVANWGSSEIAVVDLETKKLARSLFVDTTKGTWQGNPYRLAVTAGNTLVFTEQDQWCDLKLVDATTGVNISANGSLFQPDLTVTKDRATLFVGESGLSSTKLTRYGVSAAGLTQVDVSGDAGEFGAREVVLSGDDKYVFFAGQKYLASNLKSVLGKFSETIYASNSDGSVVLGNKSVFDGNTFAITAVLPISTTVLALSNDAKTVYLYDTTKSRIYVHKL